MQKCRKIPYLPLLLCFLLFLGGAFLGRRTVGIPVLRTERGPAVQSEPVTDRSAATKTTASATRTSVRPDGRVNPNTATLEELKTLPGIGAVLGQRILDYRAEHGPFQQPEDLMKVRGIGEKIFAGLRDLIDLEDVDENSNY